MMKYRLHHLPVLFHLLAGATWRASLGGQVSKLTDCMNVIAGTQAGGVLLTC